MCIFRMWKQNCDASDFNVNCIWTGFFSEEVKFPCVNQIQHVFRNRLVTHCNASFHVSVEGSLYLWFKIVRKTQNNMSLPLFVWMLEDWFNFDFLTAIPSSDLFQNQAVQWNMLINLICASSILEVQLKSVVHVFVSHVMYHVHAQRLINYKATYLPSINGWLLVFGSGNPDCSAEEGWGAEETGRPSQSDGWSTTVWTQGWN